MWCRTLFFLFVLCLPSVFGSEDMEVNFSIDYFEHRNVKFICLLSCKEDRTWSQKFAKNAMIFLTISKMEIDDSFNTLDIIKCFQQSKSSIGVLINPKCKGFKELVDFASQSMWFDSTHKWLVFKDSGATNFTEEYDFNNDRDINSFENETYLDGYNGTGTKGYGIKAVFENLNISVDADITIAKPNGYHTYDLYEAYNFGRVQGGNLILNKLGCWNSETGFNAKLNGYKYYRRWNFHQWTMRMIVVMSPPPKEFNPEMIIGRRDITGVSVITRTSAMVINVVAEMHNFNFKYTLSDRWIGYFNKNNSNVVATSLYFRDQDVTPVLRIAKNIYEKIDFVQPPLTYIETRYYYQIPSNGVGKFENQFLRPLSRNVWGCVIAVITLCTFTLLLSAKLEQRPSSAQYAVFSVLASVCQQSRKVTVLVTGISCLLIYNYYTSSVVSWLLSGPPPSINSLQELLESPLELIYEDIGYTRSWMQVPTYYYNKRNSKIEDEMRQKKVFNKKKDAPLFLPLEDGIEMVKAGGYAYHTEVDSANKLISRKFTQSELCELGSLQSMEKTNVYVGVQKNSPYKEFLNWSLIRMLERGIVSCIQRRTSSPPVACEGSSPRALALGGAAPAFLLLAAGYILATVIMILERFTKRVKWTAYYMKGA